MENSANLNIKAKKENTYDAIVVGSGITGGWAAKELCEKGLKTLVLERGRDVVHIKDYPTMSKNTWEFPHRGRVTNEMREESPIQSHSYAFNEATKQFFVSDKKNPYIQEKPFYWIRGYQVGGRSLMWGRWTQRWSDLDFEANAKEGIAIDWPIRYKDIAPWYSYVEKFVGISGKKDSIPTLPDGEFLPPIPMNCLEKHFKKNIENYYPNRHVINSRTANLTKAIHGRGPCQYRNLCARGCPFAGYFSSNSATLPAAQKTGNLSLQPNSVVRSIIYDEDAKKAKSVRVIDAHSKKVSEYYADILFLNASCINSTAILLNSTSSRFPNGLGNDSGVLGHYLMDHNYRAYIGGIYEGLQDKYYYGRKPAGIYIPRYRNIGSSEHKDFLRGYAFAAHGSRSTGDVTNETFGAAYKKALTKPGPWYMGMTGMGECLPNYKNTVSLSEDSQDEWGVPLIRIDCKFRENELNMLSDILSSGAEMLRRAGLKNVEAVDTKTPPGGGIHEMGTARMGRDPKTSVLNSHNQIWGAPNVFVTDGSCMTSGACQNPSLTYMALTARATDYAVRELKKKNI
jgi:choline dehydrogenase-like flavoprotein